MSEMIFEKILLELYKNDLFTEREILVIKEAVEKLSTDYTSKYFEIEKSGVLKKLASLSFAIDNTKERMERSFWEGMLFILDLSKDKLEVNSDE